jgi:hypothetical protein
MHIEYDVIINIVEHHKIAGYCHDATKDIEMSHVVRGFRNTHVLIVAQNEQLHHEIDQPEYNLSFLRTI